ncbi:hypothetical protein CHARACLAT_028163 [Characodon lateralis]|uniref:Secreted protein n=1 Tax=Characodon lateralis TaxID=208331 RepID=A0ABU7DBA1_9TELE|nr:hypothetical protein [Characodon lateralis]
MKRSNRMVCGSVGFFMLRCLVFAVRMSHLLVWSHGPQMEGLELFLQGLVSVPRVRTGEGQAGWTFIYRSEAIALLHVHSNAHQLFWDVYQDGKQQILDTRR